MTEKGGDNGEKGNDVSLKARCGGYKIERETVRDGERNITRRSRHDSEESTYTRLTIASGGDYYDARENSIRLRRAEHSS